MISSTAKVHQNNTDINKPLKGIRVVEFTYNLAGPLTGQLSKGYGATQRLYQSKDGWLFLESHSHTLSSLANLMGVSGTISDLQLGFAKQTTKYWKNWLIEHGVAIQAVNNFQDIRTEYRFDHSPIDEIDIGKGAIKVLHYQHPSGYQVATMAPTWVRPRKAAFKILRPAPAPGANSQEILATLGLSAKEQQVLKHDNIVFDSYVGVSEYLPS